jgi:hypothetical protein
MTRRVGAVGLFALSMACLVMCTVVPLVWGSGAGGLKNALLGTGSFALPFVLVGLVITLRRPEHPIGWGFAAAGLCSSIQAASVAYADASLHAGAHLPGDLLAANLTQWIFAPGIYLGFTMVFLRFPNGDLLGPRWRRVARLGIVSAAAISAVNALAPGPLNNYPQFDNPIGLAIPGLTALQFLSLFAYVATLFAAAAAVVIRYRRAVGIERLQMRWFLVGVIGAVIDFALMVLMTMLTGDVGPAVLLMSLLPICAGIAILRYRLFDIDRIVSRAVGYLLITGLLVGVYVGCIAVTDVVLPVGSSFGVAAATLAAAALFQPVRRRVQRAVDHRFNRSQYDAARTVDAFAVRLRDEVDPDVVRHDLLDVTARAIEPSSISLWVAS